MQSTAAPTAYQLADNDRWFHDEYVIRIKDLPEGDRPREKMIAAGSRSLTQAELLAALWGVGSKKENVLSMAQRTLREYGTHTVFDTINPTDLATTLDIPIVKAVQLVAAFELGRRAYATNRSGQPSEIRTPDQAFHYFRDMAAHGKEQLRGLYLGSRYQVIHDEIISMGSLTSNVVHPREVFQPAVERGAVAVIIAHNHPSGSLEPSTADLDVTRQLVGAGQILGIELLDHLIIAGKKYQSILELL